MNLSDSQKIEIENEKLIIRDRYLTIKNTNITARLSKNQRTLILCLMNNIIEKEKIIHNIWGRNQASEKEKNYNQLVFQTRALLKKQGFPDDLIMTIHRYGLCLNKSYLESDGVNPLYFAESTIISKSDAKL